MGTTDHYGLKRMGPGESFSDEGWKFTDGDRVLMDRLLYLGAEGHRHIGAASEPAEPGTPTLTLSELSGSIPAGTRVYYKYTLVDVEGFETAASTEVYVDTDSPVAEPAAVAPSVSTTGGTLLPGQYYYVLTAYTTVNTNETKALYPAYITVPAGTSTNQVTLTMPSLPAGATGFNLYRKGPGEPRYYYLASTTLTTPYIDTGAVEEDCNRTVPVRNSTNGTNNVTVEVPALDDGYTWKLYRTYVAGFYNNSLVHHVVEETSEGSGVITDTYVDMGLATMTGVPPTTSQSVGGPPQIDLTDMAEVQGSLPMSAVSAYPYVAHFQVAGTLTAATGTFVWVCEFPQATIQGVRASLGRGYAPASQPVIVDVNVGDGATPTMSSIFTTSGQQPRIRVGAQIGDRVVPTARIGLAEGDIVTVDIDQAGGGATPTDRDLTVSVYMLVHGYTSTTSYVAPSSPFTPNQLPYLSAWYKADAITGLSGGASVATWTDSSGAGRHLTQATGANQPTYQTGVVNSLPVVRFDGTNDYLRVTSALATSARTAFCVAKTDATGNYGIFDGITGTDVMRLSAGGTLYYSTSGSTGTQTVSSLGTPAVTPNTDWHIFACVYDDTGSLRVNGGAGHSAAVGKVAVGGLTLGNIGFLNIPLDGDIAEFLLYDYAMPLDEINAIGAHLGTKYGITWTTAV
jgi:hypothetical protein